MNKLHVNGCSLVGCRNVYCYEKRNWMLRCHHWRRQVCGGECRLMVPTPVSVEVIGRAMAAVRARWAEEAATCPDCEKGICIYLASRGRSGHGLADCDTD